MMKVIEQPELRVGNEGGEGGENISEEILKLFKPKYELN